MISVLFHSVYLPRPPLVFLVFQFPQHFSATLLLLILMHYFLLFSASHSVGVSIEENQRETSLSTHLSLWKGSWPLARSNLLHIHGHLHLPLCWTSLHTKKFIIGTVCLRFILKDSNQKISLWSSLLHCSLTAWQLSQKFSSGEFFFFLQSYVVWNMYTHVYMHTCTAGTLFSIHMCLGCTCSYLHTHAQT